MRKLQWKEWNENGGPGVSTYAKLGKLTVLVNFYGPEAYEGFDSYLGDWVSSYIEFEGATYEYQATSLEDAQTEAERIAIDRLATIAMGNIIALEDGLNISLVQDKAALCELADMENLWN